MTPQERLKNVMIEIIEENMQKMVDPYEEHKCFEKVPYTEYLTIKYGAGHEYLLLNVNAVGEYMYHKEWEGGKAGTLFENHKQAINYRSDNLWERNAEIARLFSIVYKEYMQDLAQIKEVKNNRLLQL